MEIRIFTGRTHQIRVHAAHIGHPVAGDEKYGDREANKRFKTAGLEPHVPARGGAGFRPSGERRAPGLQSAPGRGAGNVC